MKNEIKKNYTEDDMFIAFITGMGLMVLYSCIEEISSLPWWLIINVIGVINVIAWRLLKKISN